MNSNGEIENNPPLISLVVQYLRLHSFTAADAVSTPGWGTKIPQISWPKEKKKYLHFLGFMKKFIC